MKNSLHFVDSSEAFEWRDASNAVVDRLVVPSTRCGCGVEEHALSPSKKWIVTSRWSGQGECGFDVIQASPLKRCGGFNDRLGYVLQLPAFADDESFLLGGYGDRWLGGWWAHPDEEQEHPSCGGELHFGWLFKHDLHTHDVTFHELRMTFPLDWIPDDPFAETWYGPLGIAPRNGGFSLTLPGGKLFVYTGPFSDVIHLPVPTPDGTGLLG
ncbi:hypothetical protein Fuma_02626 [Fuerstiella marisgermanici]|uniref:Uncharacterized protein n=1 Tax=Fuerstiella marisgermanici TaxID=1891926 RepID=A0A1P8WG34_9PLAN|nr:hypothetical protein Fuma_02626 [Fuerstiella marisgermanici]